MSTVTWKMSHRVKESQLFFFSSRVFLRVCISSYKVSSMHGDFLSYLPPSLQLLPSSGTKHQWWLDKIYTWRKITFHEQEHKHWLLSKDLPEHWLQQETKVIRSNRQTENSGFGPYATRKTGESSVNGRKAEMKEKNYFNFPLECKTWRFCFYQKHQHMCRQGGPTYKTFKK